MPAPRKRTPKPSVAKTTKLVRPTTDIDYRAGRMPAWVKAAIEEQFAIESEDAKSAGSVGFMARALVLATMPYKDPKADVFKRQNGDFALRIVAGYEGGIPFGVYPRLLMSWIATEAVRTKSPVIELGDSLSQFLRDVLEVRSNSGGARGTATRVTEQMKRLFGSLITAQYTGGLEGRGFLLRNVMIAEGLKLAEDFEDGLGLEELTVDTDLAKGKEDTLWTPQVRELAGAWKSEVSLSDSFFRECITKPVPVDLRAYKALRGSPLAMDVYTWLTFRMSYLQRRSRPIPWEALMHQFGSTYSTASAVRDFKKAFITALKAVLIVYSKANVEVADNGLILSPSPAHITRQPDLF